MNVRDRAGGVTSTYGFFSRALADADPEVDGAIRNELRRQQDEIELIASENIVSRAVLEAQGSVLTNKYAEGYPGRRYYGGCQFVDVAENLAIERAKQLFDCRFANVQPHSGSQANQAVFLALGQARRHDPRHEPRRRRPPDPRRAAEHVGQMVQRRAVRRAPPGRPRSTSTRSNRSPRQHKPKLIIAGGSAYSRIIDFAALPPRSPMGSAPSSWSTWRISPASSPAACIPSPLPHAHVVTTTTHKTLRGPRGGMILTNDEDDRQEDQLGGLPRACRAGR